MMDINTTPLIDVMLVLLIMLIITIPMQLHAVNLELPTASAVIKKTEPVVVKITVDATGVIAWNGQVVQDRAALEQMMADAKALEPQPELHIQAHAKSKYEVVAGVLSSAQRVGLTKLGMIGSDQFAN
jgi:biopolymer transport protein ExbD